MSKPEPFNDNLKYPTVIFMHGAGTRGDNVENICLNPFFCETNILRDQAVICAPLCNQDSWFDMFESIRKDPVVLCEESIKMVDCINLNGGNAKVSVLDEYEQDVWTFVYQNPEPFQWLLGCRKESEIIQTSNLFNSADLYG